VTGPDFQRTAALACPSEAGNADAAGSGRVFPPRPVLFSRGCVAFLILAAVATAAAESTAQTLPPCSAGLLSPSRVRAAYSKKDTTLRRLCAEAAVAYPPRSVFLRIFKYEGQLGELELWAGDGGGYKLLATVPVCGSSGGPGPKSSEGDGQIPEGFYRIARFNPWSSYHLSMKIDYPNAADRARLGRTRGLGGDIFIHGECVTIGCITLSTDDIKLVYLACALAYCNRGSAIQVHIFPARMDGDRYRVLRQQLMDDKELLRFWDNLEEGHKAFESTRRIPRITAGRNGRYVVG